MTVIPLSLPTRVANQTASAVKDLTTTQIQAILEASTRRSARVLPVLWDTVRTADSELAAVLDDLHARESEADLPRFIGLNQIYQTDLSAATRSRAGKLITARVIGAGVLLFGSVLAAMAGMIDPTLAISAAVVAAFLYVEAFRSGGKMAASLPSNVFAGPETAAAIVWDSAVDAAAAVALEHRAGEAGLTPDVMKALALTWTNAGLSTDLLKPPAAKDPAKPAARRPAVKRTPKPAPAVAGPAAA